MKYTTKGFIKVSLAVETDSTIRGRKTKSMLVLKVKDSGKGISKEFLKHHLYKPFTQEDSLAVGAGLGYSKLSFKSIFLFAWAEEVNVVF